MHYCICIPNELGSLSRYLKIILYDFKKKLKNYGKIEREKLNFLKLEQKQQNYFKIEQRTTAKTFKLLKAE